MRCVKIVLKFFRENIHHCLYQGSKFLAPFGSTWLHLASNYKKNNVSTNQNAGFGGAGAGARKFQKISNPGLYSHLIITLASLVVFFINV